MSADEALPDGEVVVLELPKGAPMRHVCISELALIEGKVIVDRKAKSQIDLHQCADSAGTSDQCLNVMSRTKWAGGV